MAIYYRTGLDEMPKNCLECTMYGCNLPMKHTKSRVTDEVKVAYQTKRHPKCPLVELSEPEK